MQINRTTLTKVHSFFKKLSLKKQLKTKHKHKALTNFDVYCLFLLLFFYQKALIVAPDLWLSHLTKMSWGAQQE